MIWIVKLKNSIVYAIKRVLESGKPTARENKLLERIATLEKVTSSLQKTINKTNRAQSSEIKRLAIGARINGQLLVQQIGLNQGAENNYPSELNAYEAQVYSQNGEDGILLALFERIGTTNKTFVEIGAGGLENNTNNLFFNYGWQGLWVDMDQGCMDSLQSYVARNFEARLDDAKIVVTKVTRDNINQIIADNCSVAEPDLLTIDVDGNDAHLLRALEVVRPRVLMVEYNASFGLSPVTVPYDPDFNRHKYHSFYHGASASALTRIAESKGYRLVCCDTEGVNTVFVRNDVLNSKLKMLTAQEAFMPERRRTRKYTAAQQWDFVKEFALETVDGMAV